MYWYLFTGNDQLTLVPLALLSVIYPKEIDSSKIMTLLTKNHMEL